VATESVLLTFVIDVEEGREVAIIDIPNAFVQTVVEDPKDRVVIHIQGYMVDVLVKIARDLYQAYMTSDKLGNKILLVECLNALYGTMVVRLLYYPKFTKSLESQGYTANPYDPCVWNKVISGKQIMICFHVDDCKISHVSTKVVDNTVAWLREHYESMFEDGSGKMKVRCEKVHEYLGMTIDFLQKSWVKVTMLKYVAELIAAWEKVSPLIDSDGYIVVKSKKHTTRIFSRSMRLPPNSMVLRQQHFTIFEQRHCIYQRG
jgi:hypothetical protein